MIIPITLSTDVNAKLPSGLAQISNDEIVLIELQGALDVIVEASPTERNGKFVGKLTIDDAMSTHIFLEPHLVPITNFVEPPEHTYIQKHQKKPTLLIGHHLLEGKVAAIPKPLAIMRRTNPATRASTSGTGEMDVEETQLEESMDVDGSTGGEQAPPQWTIQGLVRKKIIFSKRPMPIISRA